MSKFWAASDSDGDSDSESSHAERNEDSSVDWDDDDSEKDLLEDRANLRAPLCNTRIEEAERSDQGALTNFDEKFAAQSALTDAKDDPHDPNLIWKGIRKDQVFAPVPTTDSSCDRDPNVTRFVCMSDTHARHRDIPFLPRGDVFIHGGDFTKSGEIGSVQDLSLYFLEHSGKFQHIYAIAGNHELTFQPDFYQTARRKHKPKPFDPHETRAALKNCTYLEDVSISISLNGGSDGIELYGSPWTPAFYDWAFNLPRGEALDDMWSKVPATTDVLLTHGPPLGRGDYTDHSGRAGCHELLQHVQNRIRPRLHIFGHIHTSHGYSFDGHTLYINASNLDSETEIASRPCIVVDLPHDKSLPARIVKPCCRHVETIGKLVSWLEEKGYNGVVDRVSPSLKNDPNWCQQSAPFPAAFFTGGPEYFELCETLGLYRDPKPREDLRVAVCQLYAECFE
ncbi:Metallophosphoesterase domain-containing protein 1 [Seminavis robusta]|uniref:Metallophosphoesterase domain-containing protein 1 n=1 Tax=Seminavis robusta TaxID=568900 RepID=A0A9N8EFE0_9STRA|nr:Metallophosphoesterase domain-containing protein 1 [Seminavis robusta]|eukprot:Sro1102_g241630.1 Metallophosphoesterase domain-containing protein 1 (452) ;mRNA; f:33773-35128